MIQRFLILIFCVFGVLGISFLAKPREKNKGVIPVRFFPFGNRATLKVEIEGKKYSLLIDLGSSHPFDFPPKYIDHFKEKKLIGTSTFKNLKGDIFTSHKFQIPTAELPGWILRNQVICEESQTFIHSAQIWPSSGWWNRIKDYVEPMIIEGRIGLPPFREFVCLFDFPHCQIVLAKDVASLADYRLETFISIPFEINEAGVIVSVTTDVGEKKFLLDTGSTRSALRKSAINEIDSAFYLSSLLKIGDHDLGKYSFCLFEFADSIPCDGILGIDFFQKYRICLDFPNKIAYFKHR